MLKKAYIRPELEIIELEKDRIIVTSDPSGCDDCDECDECDDYCDYC